MDHFSKYWENELIFFSILPIYSGCYVICMFISDFCRKFFFDKIHFGKFKIKQTKYFASTHLQCFLFAMDAFTFSSLMPALAVSSLITAFEAFVQLALVFAAFLAAMLSLLPSSLLSHFILRAVPSRSLAFAYLKFSLI